MPDFYRDTYLCQLTVNQRRVATQLLDRPMSTELVGLMIGGAAEDSLVNTRVFVSKMRRKLEGSGWTIAHNKGDGYMVVPE